MVNISQNSEKFSSLRFLLTLRIGNDRIRIMDRERYYDPNRVNLRKVSHKGKFRRVFTIAEMSQRHHEIARLLVLGKSNKEIAKLLNVSTAMVSNVRNSPQVREQMGFLSAKKDTAIVAISEQIAEALPKCVKYLTDTIDDETVSDSLKSRNAFGLLASGGYGPSKNVNVRGVHAVLTPDDIKEIRDQAAKIGISSGLIIDAGES